MADGNVMQFLHANPDTNRSDFVSAVFISFQFLFKALIYNCQVRDAARGLQYLHSNDIVHGNLKAVSLILSRSFLSI